MAAKERVQNTLYILGKDGNLYFHTDKERSRPLESVSGLITSLDFKKEEINGKEIEKLYLTFADGDETYKYGISLDSRGYATFVGQLKNADPTKFVELVAIPDKSEDGTKIYTNVIFKQGGQSIKSYYKKGEGHELPAWEQVKLGKDKIGYNKEAYHEIIASDVHKILESLNKTETKVTQPTPVENPDDLPF